MIRSNLCDNSDVFIPVKGTITVSNTADDCAAVYNTNKNNT